MSTRPTPCRSVTMKRPRERSKVKWKNDWVAWKMGSAAMVLLTQPALELYLTYSPSIRGSSDMHSAPALPASDAFSRQVTTMKSSEYFSGSIALNSRAKALHSACVRMSSVRCMRVMPLRMYVLTTSRFCDAPERAYEASRIAPWANGMSRLETVRLVVWMTMFSRLSIMRSSVLSSCASTSVE